MKKIEAIFDEKYIKSFFEVIGKGGVKEAVINVFSRGEDEEQRIPGGDIKRKARVEFYCPDSFLTDLRRDILSYARAKKDDFYVEIMNLDEKMNIIRDNMFNCIKDRRVSCL